MNVLDLFSGIGGFSLGLERAGMHTVAFCELDPYCRQVLARHWPGIRCYTDVRELTANRLADDGIGPIDLIAGGFPCQDLSLAGSGIGLAGARSGLWREFARLIREIGPRYALVENVAALLGRGMGTVLADLSALGYDAEWHCIRAADLGAPHRRDRVWIVAHPNGGRCESLRLAEHPGESGSPLGEPDRCGQTGRRAGAHGANTDVPGSPQRQATISSRPDGRDERRQPAASHWWVVEPDVGRVADGIPSRVDRLKALGNSVVPQIAEMIGRAILQQEFS